MSSFFFLLSQVTILAFAVASETFDEGELTELAFKCSLIILGLGIASMAFKGLSKWYTFRFANRLVQTVRSMVYKSLIRQPIEFFTDKNHSVGNLMNILSSDIKSLNSRVFESYAMVFYGF
jgi:ABC-type multidrug transport system fused ATPase/permease subunit